MSALEEIEEVITSTLKYRGYLKELRETNKITDSEYLERTRERYFESLVKISGIINRVRRYKL